MHTQRIAQAAGALTLAVALLLPTTAVRAVAPEATASAQHVDDAFWAPMLAPAGPLVVLVSLPAQRAYVYRNGVRIGVSPVSTGRPGYETPPGIYTVLGKEREHHSNLYDNAPMPYMQRLTWDGLALHAGVVPDRPASHGCVRLPRAFAEALFAITTPGTTVVIADRDAPSPTIASPGLFAPVDAAGNPLPPPAIAGNYVWQPERAPTGPVTVVLSTHDRQVVVLRDGQRIGQSSITLDGPAPVGTRAYVLLAGHLPEASRVAPGRPRRRWLQLDLPQLASTADVDGALPALADAIVIPPEFAIDVYDALAPGATVVVTDQPIQPTPAQSVPLLQSEPGSH